MTSVEHAQALVSANSKPLGIEHVPLGSCLGRTLAAAVKSPIDLPSFNCSAVDGYGCRSEDLGASGARLRLVGQVAAGEWPEITVGPGEAARLFTGSPMPEGVDCVVMQEDIRLAGNEVSAPPTKAGSNVRLAGEELKSGDCVFASGTGVTPAVVGALANLGITHLAVFKRPRVGVLSTGSELVPLGQQLKPGQVYASNLCAISSALEAMGCEVGEASVVADKPGSVQAAIKGMLSTHDCIVTCGGVSVGEHDLVRKEAALAGVNEVLWKVSMKPGKPFFLGVSEEGKPVFGLPGNPVSALVTLFVLVRPGLFRMMGRPEHGLGLHARLVGRLTKQRGRTEYVRAKLDDSSDGPLATPLAMQGSHMGTGLAAADCLIEAEAERDSYAPGDLVHTIRLSWSFV